MRSSCAPCDRASDLRSCRITGPGDIPGSLELPSCCSLRGLTIPAAEIPGGLNENGSCMLPCCSWGLSTDSSLAAKGPGELNWKYEIETGDPFGSRSAFWSGDRPGIVLKRSSSGPLLERVGVDGSEDMYCSGKPTPPAQDARVCYARLGSATQRLVDFLFPRKWNLPKKYF